MVPLHEVITFLVSMQISISSLQTHNVNRCGRSRPWARKVSFFFSRRRRHTTCSRDWSSDVCSSDLRRRRRRRGCWVYRTGSSGGTYRHTSFHPRHGLPRPCRDLRSFSHRVGDRGGFGLYARSEECRVGKECRSWCAPFAQKNKNACH